MKNISSIFDYFLFFKKYVGVHLYLYILVVLFLGLLEIIGISLLAPLLSQINETESQDKLTLIFNKFFISIGFSPTFNLVLFFILTISFLKMIATFFGDLYGYKIFAKFTTALRGSTTNLFYLAKYNYYLNQKFGKLVNTFTNEISKTNNSLKKFITFLSDLINFSVLLVMLVFIDWRYLLIVIIFAILYLLTTIKTIRMTKGYSYNLTNHFSQINNYFIQLLNSYKYMKTTNTFDRIEKKINNQIQKISLLIVKIGGLSSYLKSFSEFFIYLFLIVLLFIAVNFFNQNINQTLFVVLLLFRFFKKSTDSLKS